MFPNYNLKPFCLLSHKNELVESTYNGAKDETIVVAEEV